MKPTTRLRYGIETLLRTEPFFNETEWKMRNAIPGEPGAATYDRQPGTVVWCDLHEREVARCHRQTDSDGGYLTCTGIPLPQVTDPAGDAGIAAHVLADAREASRRMERIAGDAEWLLGLVRRWNTQDATPAVVANLERINRPLCERHGRFGHDRDSRTTNGTKVKRRDGSHVLNEPYRLCEWCEDFTRDFNRLPTEQEIHANVRGQKIRRPA